MDLSTQIQARGATYRIAGRYAPEYRPVVDAFVGVGALDRLGLHIDHFARRNPTRTADAECETVEV